MYYMIKASEMHDQEKKTMYIDFSHLANFPHQDGEFMKSVVQNFLKCEKHLRAGLARFMLQLEPGQQQNNFKKPYYQIAIYNLPQMNKIRELRTLSLGRLMSIYGTVTRTTDAKPELIEGNF